MRIIVCVKERFQEAEAMVATSLSTWTEAICHGNATNDWSVLTGLTRIEQVMPVATAGDVDAAVMRLIKRGYKSQEVIALK